MDEVGGNGEEINNEACYQMLRGIDMTKKNFSVGLLVSAMLLLSSVCSAKTWYVKQAGGGDFNVISSAISSAANGDSIEVHPGVYQETLQLSGKQLTIYSAEGPENTRIEGPSQLMIISSTPAGGTLVEGLTFANAVEGAVRITGGIVTLRGNVFVGNGNPSVDAAIDGGAIWAVASPQVLLEDNEFESNMGRYGGAVYASGSQVTLRGNRLSGNSGAQGGAVFAEDDSTLLVESSFFCGNMATEFGGAFYGTGGNADVSSSFFQGNSGSSGGSIYLTGVEGTDGAQVSLSNLHMMDDLATNGGKGIALDGVDAAVINTLFSPNMDGVFSLSETASLDVSYCALTGGTESLGDANIILGAGNITPASFAELGLHGDPFDGSTCKPGAYEPKVDSILIDAGSNAIKDPDNSPSDIGAYGGPNGILPVRDTDEDGHPDLLDNCPDIINADQLDTDDDGEGDVCDETSGVTNDQDNDGVPNDVDNCPINFNPDQADNDSGGGGDVCDQNDDNDPVPDNGDCAPKDASIYPGQDEICNGIDDDCDELIDEDLSCDDDADVGTPPPLGDAWVSRPPETDIAPAPPVKEDDGGCASTGVTGGMWAVILFGLFGFYRLRLSFRRLAVMMGLLMLLGCGGSGQEDTETENSHNEGGAGDVVQESPEDIQKEDQVSTLDGAVGTVSNANDSSVEVL